MTLSPETREALDSLALSEREYEAIVERLGREPNELELGLFGSLWSEHCGYKHSKPLLRLLPGEGPRVLVGAGDENAGAVDIGDGLAVVFKIESHNHPSAIEPYQGAATGVGGIVRDIFAMGARPIALLNSLRFGDLHDPRNRFLLQGVVAGISGYGNCIGIPDVGGEISFGPTYTGNPLVNAMCVGILDRRSLVSAAADAPGSALMLVGARTGRDGIHGASGLASRSFEEERELRPTVQVGNPFMEKSLIEACLELAATDLYVGIQDLGAAGLTSASVEAAAKGGAGIDLDVSRVPRRDSGMVPYEVMLSESQERMLVIARHGREDQVKAIFDKWDLECSVIGKVTGDGVARVRDGDRVEGEVPVRLLTDPPLYRLQGEKPRWLDDAQRHDLAALPLPDDGPAETLLELLASPNIASKRWVYRQYDHQVQTNTVTPPGSDAAVIRIRGTRRAIALSTDGNGRYCYLDPYAGGQIAVAEACRNVSCAGAEPIALTDCLNFGNPEKPETYYQLEQGIEGMAAASRALGAPVVSGNVSLYNETMGQDIWPTPIVGALGLIDDVTRHAGIAFPGPDRLVVLLGANDPRGNPDAPADPSGSAHPHLVHGDPTGLPVSSHPHVVHGDPDDLAGSEYLHVIHGLTAGRPRIDLHLEVAVQRACRRLIREGIAESAHDCSDGGLAVALAESCIAGNVGFRADFAVTGRWDAALFGERQSRIIVSIPPDREPDLRRICAEVGAPYLPLGRTAGATFRLVPSPSQGEGQDGGAAPTATLDIPVTELAHTWNTALERALTG